MKIDYACRAASARCTSALGCLLLALGLVLLAAGLYLVLSDFGSRRSGHGPLVMWASCLPLLMRNTLEGPSVLTLSFVPALFSYQRGFVFRAVRISHIDRVRVDGQTFEVIRKNGKALTVRRSEFPGVDFEALARRLEEACRTHADILSFFQSQGVAGFSWIDPNVRQPASDKQKKIAAFFFPSLALALVAWALYLFSGR